MFRRREDVIPLTPESSTGKVLQSWKDIATFFDVTVRTVQNWESDRGLPVHRLPGTKGRVFAYVDELEAWRSQVAAETLHEEAVAEPEPPKPDEPGLPAAPVWWRRVPWAVPALVVLVGAVLAAAWGLRPRAVPARVRTEGQAVIVHDAAGREMWRRVLPVEPVPFDPLRAQYEDPPKFLDLDGDGRPELFYPVHFALGTTDEEELYVFSPDGALLWHKAYGKLVQTAKGPVDGPYIIRRFALVPGAGGRESRIVLTAISRLHSATRLMMLDRNGDVLREYWHGGHAHSLLVTDHDGDGRPEIYLGSVANGYHCADVTVLDPDTLSGASVETDPGEQILGMGPPVEKARILLPVSSISKAVQPYNGIAAMFRMGGELVVSTDEDMSGKYKGAINFSFGPKLTLLRASPNDMNYATHHQLHLLKLLPDELSKEEVDSYRNIRVLTPWH